MPDDMILSVDDFPEVTTNENPEGLAPLSPSGPDLPPKMPPLEPDEIEDKSVTVTVVQGEPSEEPEEPVTTPPMPLPREIPFDELPEPIVVPSRKV